jgi:leader peptidase (prepilin peptidase)/N-methyltransferase
MKFFPVSFETTPGMPEIIGYILVFVFGAMIGSFLNVVIHRVPNGESIVFPDSACPKCKSPIKFYDNIPLLSWFFLDGNCRYCNMKISPRYPAVELLNALIFILVYRQIGFTAFLPVCLIFVASIIALMFIDAEHMILPNVITYPLLAFALIVRLIFPLFSGVEFFSDLKSFPLNQLEDTPIWLVSLIGAVLGALIGGGSLWLIGEIWKRLRGVEAMGLGDVKMMFAVGAFLGWRLAILTIFVGAFCGAIIGVFVIAKQKNKDLQTQVPFGTFLGTGAILSLLFGEQMIKWYFDTFF